MTTKHMFVSVIVCTYNRSALLERLLISLSGQTLSPDDYEVIVVIDGSTDDSDDVCHRMAAKLPNMRTILEPKNVGLSNAGNIAIKYAKGECLVFTDDDCIPRPDWIESMRDALRSDDIVAGGIDSPKENFLTLAGNISEFHPFMRFGSIRQVDFIAGANMGFRREPIHALDGFRKDFPTPDMELILRARKQGYKIHFHPECRILHCPTETELSSVLMHARSYSKMTIKLRNEYCDLLDTPFYLRNPWWLLVFTPFIAVGKTLQIFLGNPRLLRWIHTAPLVSLLKFNWCLGAFRGLRDLSKKNNQKI